MSRTPEYFSRYEHLELSREDGILTVRLHTGGGPILFSARDHSDFVNAFYEIARDEGNRVVILTGCESEWMAEIDLHGFPDLSEVENWAKLVDEGSQVLENLANVRAPMICAVEGRAWLHSEYALLCNVVIAGRGATFNDAPHFAGGIVPGDGVFTLWSYMAGPGRAQWLLLNPQPISAETAREWGVVAEVVADGKALARAKEMARSWLDKPNLTLRNTRYHFMQPIKERLVRELGYGLVLEGESARARAKAEQSPQ